MSAYVTTINLMANGNILPTSFVKGDPSNAFKCLQAGAGDIPIGISGTYLDYAPGSASDTGYESAAGAAQLIYPPFTQCLLTCGTAWSAFQFVGPDSSGKGAPGGYGAYTLEGAAAGEQGRVIVMPPPTGLSGLSSSVYTTAVSYTATASDNGKTIIVTAADRVVTLPAAVVGMKYKVVATGTGATGGSVGTTVAIPGTDTLGGNGFTAAAGKGAINTHATAADGDWIELTATAANTWYVTGIKGTWARVA